MRRVGPDHLLSFEGPGLTLDLMEQIPP
jgi:hypothetical protein